MGEVGEAWRSTISLLAMTRGSVLFKGFSMSFTTSGVSSRIMPETTRPESSSKR